MWATKRFLKAKSYNFYFQKMTSQDLLVQIGYCHKDLLNQYCYAI